MHIRHGFGNICPLGRPSRRASFRSTASKVYQAVVKQSVPNGHAVEVVKSNCGNCTEAVFFPCAAAKFVPLCCRFNIPWNTNPTRCSHSVFMIPGKP